MSYNSNDGHGAIDRYTELVKNLLKLKKIKYFIYRQMVTIGPKDLILII